MLQRTMRKLYLKLPSCAKNAAVSLYGLHSRQMRHGVYFNAHYPVLMANMARSAEDLWATQLEMLRSLLRETYQFAPYYRRLIDQAGGLADLLACPDAGTMLGKLPRLDKDGLRANMDGIINQNPSRPAWTTSTTSGTTGIPTTVLLDKESLQITFAQWERYYRWLGLPDTFKSVRISGNIVADPERRKAPFWVYNRASRQLLLSAYHMQPGNMTEYARILSRFAPDLIDGYPSALYVIARYFNEMNIHPDCRPKAISVTAETLLPYQRAEIEKAFGCKVYNQYASSDGAPWIVECHCGSYHLWTDTGVFEFVNRQPADDEIEMADLLITSFRMRKTPLIRYEIGDAVLLDKQGRTCPCGSNFPVVKEIIGRQDDLIYTRERGYIACLGSINKYLHGIFRFKFVQTDEDNLDVFIIPNPDYDQQAEKDLLGILHETLGDIHVNLKIVAEIPLNKNGKFKSTENLFLKQQR